MLQLSLWPSDAEGSTWLPAGSRARISRRRGRARDWPDPSLDCGLSCCGWCVRCDPPGFWLRTSLLSALAELTSYCLAWKRRATPAGRSWWVLETSGRLTDGSESGSSEGEWPTPTVCGNANRRGASATSGDGLWTAAAEWGTPRVGNQYGAGRDRGNNRGRLEDQVHEPEKEWPTPLASDGRPKGTAGTRRHQGLDAMARTGDLEWPTPTARDHRSICASPETHERNARPLSEVVGLEWSTPASRDWKGSFSTGHGRDLSSDIAGLPAEDQPSTPGKPRGSLNPAWVAQLQGLPEGWLDLPAEKLSELWATRIRRK